jgi:hypothetical protein
MGEDERNIKRLAIVCELEWYVMPGRHVAISAHGPFVDIPLFR